MKTHYKAIINHIKEMVKKLFESEDNYSCVDYFDEDIDMTCDLDAEYVFSGDDIELITCDEDLYFYGYVFDNWDDIATDEVIVYISKN